MIGQVTPWNYPLMMAIWKSGRRSRPATRSCSSPPRPTPVTTVRLAELPPEILPKGVLNIVMRTGAPTGEALDRPPATSTWSR